MSEREKILSEILRLISEQTNAIKGPLASVQAVEERAKRIDELVERIAVK
jgi:hypothetical protein